MDWLIFTIYVFIIIFFLITFILIFYWIILLKEPPVINENLINNRYAKSSVGNKCLKVNKNNFQTIPEEYTPQECDIGLECVYELSDKKYGICKKIK